MLSLFRSAIVPPGPSCWRVKCILLLLTAVPTRLPAQSSATPSLVLEKSSSQTRTDFSQEPAIYEYLRASMRYENDGSGTREIRARIRVQTKAGLNVAGQLVFDYNAVDEQLDAPSVRVIKRDGGVVTVGPEAIQDLSAPVTQEAPMYTDARQKHVTVPAVSTK